MWTWLFEFNQQKLLSSVSKHATSHAVWFWFLFSHAYWLRYHAFDHIYLFVTWCHNSYPKTSAVISWNVFAVSNEINFFHRTKILSANILLRKGTVVRQLYLSPKLCVNFKIKAYVRGTRKSSVACWWEKQFLDSGLIEHADDALLSCHQPRCWLT